MTSMTGLKAHKQISGRTTSRSRSVKTCARFQPFSGQATINKVAPAFLAAVVSVTAGLNVPDVVFPAPAYSEEEEVDESTLTPYERRQRELAKRRELLRQAREKALEKAASVDDPSAVSSANAAVEAANEQRKSAAEELKSSISTESLSFYEQQANKRKSPFSSTPAPPPAISEPEPAPVPEEPKPAPKPFFQAAPKPAPPPVVAPPPAPPAPVKVEAPKPVPVAAKKVEEKKPEAPKKRRGPLPTFLAQVLVLGAYAGMAAAATKYSEETSAALSTARELVISTYQKAEKALASKST